MCYNLQYLTQKKIKYIHYHGLEDEDTEKLMEELERFQEVYFVNGFAHPDIPVITNDKPKELQFFHWGLVPSWTKDHMGMAKIIKNTLNARGETIFEKPAFRNSAKKKRCLVTLDAFYEYHHFGGLKYPFRVSLKSDDPMICAGLWEQWRHEDTVMNTVSIVTCEGNPLMANIHNNPALKKRGSGPRMPVILPKELQNEWLREIDPKDPADVQRIQELIQPYPLEEMVASTVPPLTGNNGVYNSPKAIENFDYPELGLVIDDILCKN